MKWQVLGQVAHKMCSPNLDKLKIDIMEITTHSQIGHKVNMQSFSSLNKIYIQDQKQFMRSRNQLLQIR